MSGKVSVVIPTFNREKFITKALDSVMDQTYQDYEVVVMDDGSKDNTREIVENYGKKVSYFYQENRGIASARNEAIKRSSGDYIAFLDSDDYWVREKLETQIDLFDKHPEYGMVASCCSSIRLDGSFREKNRPGKSGWVLRDLFNKNFIRTSSALIKKECLSRVGLFDEDFRECEEYDLWLRIAAMYPIGFINDSLAVYVDNAEGISTDSLAGRLFRLKVLEKEYLAKKIPPKMYNKRISNTCHYIGRHYITRGDTENGRIYLKKAQELDPINVKNLFYLLLSFTKS
jgi:glycosyltransferase involved in cell wall biosynthesis